MKRPLLLFAFLLNSIGLIILASAFFISEEGPLFFNDRAQASSMGKAFAFPGLPEGVPRPIDVDLMDSATFQVLSLGEKEEQIRDWLLYLVLTSSGLETQAIAEATYNMPPIRRQYEQTTGAFQHGLVRTALLAEGIAVGLFPKGQREEERQDSLAKVADQFLLEQEETLNRLYVIEYCIDWPNSSSNDSLLTGVSLLPGQLNAQQNVSVFVTNQGFIEGQRLYSPEFGFIEANIRNQDDLRRFLAETDDLIEFKVAGDSGILVTGRKYKSRTYGQVTVEHIATLWQGFEEIEKELNRDHQRKNRLVQNIADEVVYRYLKGIDSRLADELITPKADGSFTFSLSLLGAEERETIRKVREEAANQSVELINQFSREYGGCRWQERLEGLRQGRNEGNLSEQQERVVGEFISYKQKLTSHQQSLLRGAIGFSLDTDYDFDVLKKSFLTFLKTDKTFIADALKKFKTSILEGINDHDPDLLLCILQGLKDPGDDKLFRYAEGAILADSRFQISRYDGGIEGTEVGQILFITDLLAKLLDFNFSGIFKTYFEDRKIDWIPSVYRNIPIHYVEQQKKLPGTRIWFGLKNEAFSVDTTNATVKFSHIAARVFALSKKIFGKDEETQPAYLATQFTNWFNNYYDKVGAAENRYDQLNQIVKWSLALDLAAMEARNGRFQLSFLNKYSVRRNLWFPKWVETHHSVNGTPPPWVSCFHARGDYRDDVETLSVFHISWDNAPETWCDGTPTEEQDISLFRVWSMNGGVSLPRVSKNSGKYRPSSLITHPRIRRANIIEDGLATTSKSSEFKLIPEYNYRRSFQIDSEPGVPQAKVTRIAERGKRETDGSWVIEEGPVYHRGAIAEVRNQPFSEVYSSSPVSRSLEVQSKVGEASIARTSFTANTNTFRIHQQSSVVDIGQSLALRLGRFDPQRWSKILLNDPRVAVVAKFDKASIFVKLKGEQKWIELAVEKKIGVDITEGWLTRVSSEESPFDFLLNIKPHSVNVRPISEENVAAKAAEFKWLSVKRHFKDNNAHSIEIRGPPSPPVPPKGPTFAVGSPDGPYSGFFDSKTHLAVFKRDRPANPKDFNYLLTVVEKTDLEKTFLQATKHGEKKIVLPVPESSPKVGIEDLNRLAQLRKDSVSKGFINDSSGTVEAIRSARKEHINTLRTASRSNRTGIQENLINEFSSTYRFTTSEKLEFALARIRNRVSRQSLDAVKEVVSTISNPTEIPQELAARIVALNQKGDIAGAEKLLKASHLFGAESQQMGRSASLSFKVEEVEGTTSLKSRLFHPIEKRRLAEGELEDIAKVFIDKRFSLSESPTPETVQDVLGDAIVLKINDPQKLVGKAIFETQPDIVELGKLGGFKPVNPSKPKLNLKSLEGKTPNEQIDQLARLLSRVSPDVFGISASDEDDSPVLFLTNGDMLNGTCFQNKGEALDAQEMENVQPS